MGDVNNFVDEYERRNSGAQETGVVQDSTEVVPENIRDVHSTWCTWCNREFEYDLAEGVPRFCSGPCQEAHERRLTSDDPSQEAIREYLERTRHHPGWE